MTIATDSKRTLGKYISIETMDDDDYGGDEGNLTVNYRKQKASEALKRMVHIEQ
jgi:hypothetical protein